MLAVVTTGTHAHVEPHHPAHGPESTAHGSPDMDHWAGHLLDGEIDVEQGTGLTGKLPQQPVLLVALFMVLLVSLLAPPVQVLSIKPRERPPRRPAGSRFMPPSQAPPAIGTMG